MGFVASEKMGLVFTCNVCETRVARKISRRAYKEGTCLVKCPGCAKYHVIADNLGSYAAVTERVGGGKNVEDFAKASGEQVTKVSGDVYDLEKLIADGKGKGVVDVGEGEVALREESGESQEPDGGNAQMNKS